MKIEFNNDSPDNNLELLKNQKLLKISEEIDKIKDIPYKILNNTIEATRILFINNFVDNNFVNKINIDINNIRKYEIKNFMLFISSTINFYELFGKDVIPIINNCCKNQIGIIEGEKLISILKEKKILFDKLNNCSFEINKLDLTCL